MPVRALSWGRYARTGLLTIGASVLANAVFFYLAQVAAQYDPAFLPLGNVSAPIIFTVFPAVVATVLYAGLLQFVRKHAAMVFTVTSAITFVVTLIPDLTYIPGRGRVTWLLLLRQLGEISFLLRSRSRSGVVVAF